MQHLQDPPRSGSASESTRYAQNCSTGVNFGESRHFHVAHPASSCHSTVDYTVEWNPQVETIQVDLDKKLLRDTDRAALRTKRNRSALVRDALREHLRRLTVQSLEQRDRVGYSERPPAHDESALWESEAAWPKE